MHRLSFALLLVLAAAFLRAPRTEAQVCQDCPSFEKTSSLAYKNLSSLAGCWKGKGPNSLAVKVIYQLMSDKTVLLETMSVENNPTMLTIYYLDREVAMAHHFCSYGNQLRMRSQPSANPNVLTFNFLDSSNMKDANDNHMTYIKFLFRDQDHFDVEWGLHNRKDMPQPFVFRRVVQGCSTNLNEW